MSHLAAIQTIKEIVQKFKRLCACKRTRVEEIYEDEAKNLLLGHFCQLK